MIELNHIHVSFDETTVLEDFALSVRPGEHIALMGPSGSGKSTILKLLSGQLTPDSGTMQVHAKRITYLYQEPRLIPWLTAAENVNLVLGDTPKTMPVALDWLNRVGLGDAPDKRPGQLSGGMRQRAALARALAYNGDLFLLDEPLSALDEDMAAELLTLIKQYTTGKTVVLVTHSTAQAKAFADTIYVLKQKT